MGDFSEVFITREEGLRRIALVVAEGLALEVDEITPGASLVDDLGADSLDFVDLFFALETEFGISIRDTHLDVVSRLDFSSPETVRGGYLTAQVVERLTPWLPALKDEPALDHVSPARLFSVITVETLWLAIKSAVGA